MPPLEDCNCSERGAGQPFLGNSVKSWCRASSTHFVTMSILWPSLPLSHWFEMGAERFLVSSSPYVLPSNWQGFLFFWKRCSPRLWKVAQLSQRKLLSRLCCHFLLSMLPLQLEWCAFRTSLAAIYLQKYWAFSKKYSVISFSITAVRFWFKFLTEYAGDWNHPRVCLCSSGKKFHSV